MPQASRPAAPRRAGRCRPRCAPAGAPSQRARLDRRARPQRVGAVFDDLAVDLLAAEPRAGIARQHLVEEAGRQMRRVGDRAGARHRAARIGDQPLQQRDRPRRGGDQLTRMRPEPQAELQHVEGGLRLPPFGQLVAPGGVELRPAQAFRVLGREGFRHRAVRPFQPAAATRSTAAVRRAARCLRCRPVPRSSPRARRARIRRPARCVGRARGRKAGDRAPARAPIRRRAWSCRRRARRAQSRRSTARHCWRAPAAPDGDAPGR